MVRNIGKIKRSAQQLIGHKGEDKLPTFDTNSRDFRSK